jgi:hypothetical protein
MTSLSLAAWQGNAKPPAAKGTHFALKLSGNNFQGLASFFMGSTR